MMKRFTNNHSGEKHTRAADALLASLLSTVLCLVLLVGSTFAWYTASVSTPTQTIQAGSIVAKLSYYDSTAATASFRDATATGVKLFGEQTLNPGDVVYVIVKVENAGDIGFGYDIVPLLTKNVIGLGYESKVIDLTTMVKVTGVALAETELADEAAIKTKLIAAAKEDTAKLLSCYDQSKYTGDQQTGKLEKTEISYHAIGLYVPEDTNLAYDPEDEANRPEVEVMLRLRASQLVGEAENRKATAMPWDGTTLQEVKPTTEKAGTEDETKVYAVACAEELGYVINCLTTVPDLSGKYEIRITESIELNGRPIELKPLTGTDVSVKITGTNVSVRNLNMKTDDMTVTEQNHYLFAKDADVTYDSNITFSGTSVSRP